VGHIPTPAPILGGEEIAHTIGDGECSHHVRVDEADLSSHPYSVVISWWKVTDVGPLCMCVLGMCIVRLVCNVLLCM
jgi:hypothetical protein